MFSSAGQTSPEVIEMAKQGMKRPERTHTAARSDAPAVPELQGKAKHAAKAAPPILAGTHAPEQKVYHAKPHSTQQGGELSLIHI